MMPVSQTKIHNTDTGVMGNCFAACVASILERPILSVPTFEMLMGTIYAWPAIEAWLESQGYFLLKQQNGPAGFSIACGPTDRHNILDKEPGVEQHCCIAENGMVIFDPHPSRSGLKRIDFYLTINQKPEGLNA